MRYPKVSVIIVNWNRYDDVSQSVAYLKDGGYFEQQIIVVDNGSNDGSDRRLARLDGIDFVRLEKNQGPIVARNAGVDAAMGKYIVFLDSDAFLAKRGLLKLVERMESDARLGVIGCKVMNYFSREIDQWIYAQPKKTHHRQEFETYSFSAAGALIRAEALRRAGGFWGRLFMYNEEVDLSIRILRAGYRIIYTPHVRVYHRVSPRGRERPRAFWYYQIRNWIWIFYRHYPSPVRWKKIAMFSFVYLIKGAASFKIWTCLTGIAAGLRGRNVVGLFPDKLSTTEMSMLDALNRRTSIRLGR